jgi:hypothetical protein
VGWGAGSLTFRKTVLQIGYMIPRFIGMILDGSDGGQWRLVFIEGVILVITIALMVYRRRQLAEEADVETGAEEED